MKVFSFFIIYMMVFMTMGMNACQIHEKNKSSEVYLKLHLNPDDVYIYSMQQTQNIKSIGNNSIVQNLNLSMKYQMTDSSEENSKLKITYTHIALNNNNSVQQFNYDSDYPERKSLLKSLGNIIGSTYYLNFAKNGQLKEIIQPPTLDKKYLAKDDLAKIMNDSAFSILLKNNFDIYPGKPVKLDEQWHNKTSMSLFSYELIKKNTYILKSLNNGVATISSNAELKIPELEINEAQINFRVELEGHQYGTLKIDLATGMIISNVSNLELTGSIYTQGQKIPLNITAQMNGSSKLIK